MSAARVYTLCLRLLADRQLADVVTKNVFLTAWKNIGMLKIDVSFSSWLCSIAVYSSLEKLRQENSFSGSTSEKKDKNPNIKSFDLEILSLPIKERLTFVLHDLEKYTETETAELLMIKTEEVKKSLINAHSQLKAANSSLSQVTPLSERIKNLTNQILPGNEIWKQISYEIQSARTQSSLKQEEDSEPSEESENPKQGRKFNIFGWKRK